MDDKEIFKLTNILSRTGIEKISFEFQDAYCDIVYCIIERRQHDLIPVMSHSDSSDDALKLALELIKEVESWDKVLKMPSQEDQPCYHGYHREMLDDDHEVVFQNIGKKFAITEIHQKDSEGFVYSDKPFPIKEATTRLIFVKDLPDGTQLWRWNDIGALCGSAGDVIVKNGLVIKSKMTAIS